MYSVLYMAAQVITYGMLCMHTLSWLEVKDTESEPPHVVNTVQWDHAWWY